MVRSKVFVFDSLYKTIDKTRYQDIVELIKFAWTYLCEKYLGKFNKNLFVHYDWLVCIPTYSLLTNTIKTYFMTWFSFPYVQFMRQPSGTNLCGYYVCEYMHRVTGCIDGTKFEEKVCAHTTATTCSSYCSYS
jgi:hypothetical protein